MTALEQILLDALEQAQVYLDSYDTSAPSRVKAMTRAEVTAAIAEAKAERADAARLQSTKTDNGDMAIEEIAILSNSSAASRV